MINDICYYTWRWPISNTSIAFLSTPICILLPLFKIRCQPSASRRLSNTSRINVWRIFHHNWHYSETRKWDILIFSERLFKSSCSLLSKTIKRCRAPYFTWNVFCYATYMFKIILFCLANKSTLYSHSSSIMTRFWYFIVFPLVRKSIECQSSSQPRNAPFPQHRDFQIRSDVLSPPRFSLTLLILSVVDLSLQTLRFSKQEMYYSEGSGLDKLCTSSLLRQSAFKQGLVKQSIKPWIEDELHANMKTTVRESQLWINHEWDCIICCLSQDVTDNCLRSTK